MCRPRKVVIAGVHGSSNRVGSTGDDVEACRHRLGRGGWHGQMYRRIPPEAGRSYMLRFQELPGRSCRLNKLQAVDGSPGIYGVKNYRMIEAVPLSDTRRAVGRRIGSLSAFIVPFESWEIGSRPRASE